MQVESPEVLRAQVHRACDNVEIPMWVEQMRLPKCTGDDSYEMAAALVGRKWDAVPIEVLFYHRESLATLSPLAFHAYLPAYLVASLASDDPFDKHGADIRGYLLFALGSCACVRADTPRCTSADGAAPIAQDETSVDTQYNIDADRMAPSTIAYRDRRASASKWVISGEQPRVISGERRRASTTASVTASTM